MDKRHQPLSLKTLLTAKDFAGEQFHDILELLISASLANSISDKPTVKIGDESVEVKDKSIVHGRMGCSYFTVDKMFVGFVATATGTATIRIDAQDQHRPTTVKAVLHTVKQGEEPTAMDTTLVFTDGNATLEVEKDVCYVITATREHGGVCYTWSPTP